MLWPDFLTFFLTCVSMVVTTRGLGSSDPKSLGTSNDEILRIITAKVAAVMREMIFDNFGSIKIMLIELFDERYVVVTKVAVASATSVVAATRPHGGDSMQYWEFKNRKPMDFDGNKYPIATIGWIFDVEGCFYTCSYP